MNRFVTLVLGFMLALLAGDVNDDLLDAARKGDLAAVRTLCEKGAAIRQIRMRESQFRADACDVVLYFRIRGMATGLQRVAIYL